MFRMICVCYFSVNHVFFAISFSFVGEMANGCEPNAIDDVLLNNYAKFTVGLR
jgi:hypothetical protein